jgi:ribosomal protein S18 acetylase RimI-like enzyme
MNTSQKQHIKVRLAGIRDTNTVAELFDLYRQFYEQQPDIGLARNFIRERIERRESKILLAEDADGNALGFCQLYPSHCSVLAKPVLVLYDLFVASTARHCGVGKRLLLAAEALAKHHGFARMDLSTAKTNLGAQALYEKLGWLRDDEFFTYNKAVA